MHPTYVSSIYACTLFVLTITNVSEWKSLFVHARKYGMYVNKYVRKYVQVLFDGSNFTRHFESLIVVVVSRL